ncbi:MAG: dihydroorotate dehydrogenase [Herpetosiphon sp.]
MIDLAPHNPYSVALRGPVIVGAGMALRELDLALVGAVLTRMTTVHTRTLGAPMWAAAPAGVVFSHEATASVRTLLRDDLRRWRRSPVPVWGNILGSVDELCEIIERLEGNDVLAGFVMEVEGDSPAYATQRVRSQTGLPLAVALPMDGQIDTLASEVVRAGADALVVGVPPTATMFRDGVRVTGRLYGPALVPLMLSQLEAVRVAVDVPLVALGGIGNGELARTCLSAGADAVIVDAARWGDPFAAERIATALQDGRAETRPADL